MIREPAELRVTFDEERIHPSSDLRYSWRVAVAYVDLQNWVVQDVGLTDYLCQAFIPLDRAHPLWLALLDRSTDADLRLQIEAAITDAMAARKDDAAWDRADDARARRAA